MSMRTVFAGVRGLLVMRDVSVRLGVTSEAGHEDEGGDGAGSSTDVLGVAWWVVERMIHMITCALRATSQTRACHRVGVPTIWTRLWADVRHVLTSARLNMVGAFCRRRASRVL